MSLQSVDCRPIVLTKQAALCRQHEKPKAHLASQRTLTTCVLDSLATLLQITVQEGLRAWHCRPKPLGKASVTSAGRRRWAHLV